MSLAFILALRSGVHLLSQPRGGSEHADRHARAERSAPAQDLVAGRRKHAVALITAVAARDEHVNGKTLTSRLVLRLRSAVLALV